LVELAEHRLLDAYRGTSLPLCVGKGIMERAQSDLFLVQRNVILGLLLALAAMAAWALLARQGANGHMDMTMASPTMGMRAPLFVTIWVVMMVAMMFPSAAPMILTFHKVQVSKRHRGEAFVATWVFVTAYMLVWTLSGAIAYVGALVAEAIAARATLSPAAAARIGGAILVAAGLYQLTPLKDLCLSKCRTPISFIMTSWRDGVGGALRMGLHHGVYCLGCCWLLFVILFPLGIMNIPAMAMITLVIFAEKTLPWGRPVARTTAAALVAYGAVVLATPQVLPTFMIGGDKDMAAPAAPLDMQNMPMPGNIAAPHVK
jgi:predicted metal-binding membrane protein